MYGVIRPINTHLGEKLHERMFYPDFIETILIWLLILALFYLIFCFTFMVVLNYIFL